MPNDDDSFYEADAVTSDNESGNEQQDSEGEGTTKESEAITLTRAELDEREREIRKEQDKRWKDRLKNAGKDGESRKESDKEVVKREVTPDERYDRLELKTEGVKDAEQQDFVLEYARLKKIAVTDALASKVVQAELREMQEYSKKKEAVPGTSQRAVPSRSVDDVTYWAGKLKDKGEQAPSPEMRKKVRKYLAGK